MYSEGVNYMIIFYKIDNDRWDDGKYVNQIYSKEPIHEGNNLLVNTDAEQCARQSIFLLQGTLLNFLSMCNILCSPSS